MKPFARRLRAIATMLLCAPLAGCAATVIQSNASSCAALLPTEWEKGVAPASLPVPDKLPDGHDDARPWQLGFLAQTGQLEVANGRYADAVGIVQRCEARDAAAVKKAKRFLGLF